MDVLVKMFRIYRISDLFKLLSKNTNLRLSNSVYRKFKQLVSQTAIMIPILIVRFFPLFLIFYYFLGIIGMEDLLYPLKGSLKVNTVCIVSFQTSKVL
jgi:hypothetical protein